MKRVFIPGLSNDFGVRDWRSEGVLCVFLSGKAFETCMALSVSGIPTHDLDTSKRQHRATSGRKWAVGSSIMHRHIAV